MIISIGGSVSTGSTPWIDIISAYDEVKVLQGELRIGESGLYEMISKLYTGQALTEEEFFKVRNSLINYGQRIPFASRLLFSLLLRVPGIPPSTINKVNQYRKEKRSYDKRLPGFSLYSKSMLKELELFNTEAGSLTTLARKIKIQQLMHTYFTSLQSSVGCDNKVVFDQLFSPRLLFDQHYGCIIPDVINDVKIVVVRRDPRDQFIDLLLKEKTISYDET